MKITAAPPEAKCPSGTPLRVGDLRWQGVLWLCYDPVSMGNVVFDRITIEPGQCDGKPCIRGLRIPVHLILRLLANGKTPAQIIEVYPELESRDIQQAVEYAAWLANERTIEPPSPPK